MQIKLYHQVFIYNHIIETKSALYLHFPRPSHLGHHATQNYNFDLTGSPIVLSKFAISVAMPSVAVIGCVARPSSTYPNQSATSPKARPDRTRTKVGKHVPFREDVLGRQGHVRRETVSTRPLPPRLGCPAARYFKQSPRRLGVVLASEIAHNGSDVIGLGGCWLVIQLSRDAVRRVTL